MYYAAVYAARMDTITPGRVLRGLMVSAFLVSLFMLLLIAQAGAQEEVDKSISLYRIFGPWLEVLVGALATVVTAILGWVAAAVQKKTGIEIEFLRSQTLQTAITNGAGKVVMMAGDKLKDIKFTIENDTIRQAVLYVIDAAPEAVKHFGLSPSDIAEKIIAKVGVVTAANPEVNPTTSST